MVVAAPSLDLLGSILQAQKPGLIQALLPPPAGERFDAGIVRGFPWPGKVQDFALGLGPQINSPGVKPRAAVHRDARCSPIFILVVEGVVMAHRPADLDLEVDVGAFDSPPPSPDPRNYPAGGVEEVFPGDGWKYLNHVPFEGLFGRLVGQHPYDCSFNPFEGPRFKQPDPVAKRTQGERCQYEGKDRVTRPLLG
jgi:hypothetical protein